MSYLPAPQVLPPLLTLAEIAVQIALSESPHLLKTPIDSHTGEVSTLTALRGSKTLTIPLRGLPTLSPATLEIFQDLTGLRIAILSLGSEQLTLPYTFSYQVGTTPASRVTGHEAVPDAKKRRQAGDQREKRKKQRPDAVLANGLTWRLVSGPGKEALKRQGGRDIVVPVDTAVYCYRTTCTCGRARYVKPNDIFQVRFCRICQSEKRREKKRKFNP